MVKGVTRRIVEIKETGSNYFERAIFFVRMEGCHSTNEFTLSQEARRIIDSFSNELTLSAVDKKQKRRQTAISVLKLMISAVAGALAATIIIKFS